jgi:hypothetical protein
VQPEISISLRQLIANNSEATGSMDLLDIHLHVSGLGTSRASEPRLKLNRSSKDQSLHSCEIHPDKKTGHISFQKRESYNIICLL